MAHTVERIHQVRRGIGAVCQQHPHRRLDTAGDQLADNSFQFRIALYDIVTAKQGVATDGEGLQRVVGRQGVHTTVGVGGPDSDEVGVGLRNKVTEIHIHSRLGGKPSAPVERLEHSAIHLRVDLE